MFRFIAVLLILFLPFLSSGQEPCDLAWKNILKTETIENIYQPLIGLCDNDLLLSMRKITSTNIAISYNKTRREMFTKIDNIDGVVCSVYSRDFCIETFDTPNSNVMNCEHSWPQSLGATGIAKTDLHHLYPVEASVNSRRNSHPFCEVDIAVESSDDGILGTSTYGTWCFEPPDKHKTSLARSMMYFSMRYGLYLDHEQEQFFRSWNTKNKTDAEVTRNNMIESFQHNRNPFVDHPSFIDLIEDF